MTTTPMTPDREQEIRRQLADLLYGTYGQQDHHRTNAIVDVVMPVVLAAVCTEDDRLRTDSNELRQIHVNTLPQMRREIQHHQDGKARWRDRAEKAEARVAELEAERPSRFSATSAQIDTFLRAILSEDTYLGFQQAIGAHALEEAVEDAGAVRASADNDGLYNADWREGWDDAIERVDPDHNDPCPTCLIEFGEVTP